MNYHYVTSNDQLQLCCHQASQQERVALDTEFVWTRTYYPQLGLIQLSWGAGHTWLLDPLTITDPTPLAELLNNGSVVKVLHEAASDLPILRRWCGGMATNVFDTRIAAGFSGISATESLHSLLENLLAVQLAKTETRTDWLQRPLTSAQLKYAAEDVIWLSELSRKLQIKINELNNQEWFAQEMMALEKPDFYLETKPKDSWRKVAGASSLKGKDFAVLRELAAWREQTARDTNLAKPRVIRDEQMIFVAEQQPETLAECHNIPRYWPKSVAKYGRKIIDIVQKTAADYQPGDKQPRQCVDKKIYRKFANRLLQLMRKKAQARGIDPVVVTARKEVERLVIRLLTEDEQPSTNALLQGWRHELLTPQIEQVMAEIVDAKDSCMIKMAGD